MGGSPHEDVGWAGTDLQAGAINDVRVLRTISESVLVIRTAVSAA
jgi:hypothetical protein